MSKASIKETKKQKIKSPSVVNKAFGQQIINSDWYKSIVQSAIEGFLLIKLPEGDIVDVNDAFCQMIGYSHDELLSMSIKCIDIEFIGSPKNFNQKVLEVKETGGAFFEARHKHKNGKIIDVLVSLKYLDSGDGFLFCFHRDITKEKEIYQSLKESEEKYRLLAENVADVVFTCTLDGVYTYVSPSVKRLRGYTAEEAMAQSNKDELTPESLEKGKKILEEALAAERAGIRQATIRTEEHELLCKDGSTVWAEIKTDFIRDKNGKPIGIVGICRDLTERKKAEESLKESEERYKALVDTAGKAGEGIIVLQDTGEVEAAIIFINPQLIKKLGYRKDEIIGISVREFLPDKYKDMLREVYIARQKGENVPSSYETEIICKNGELLPIETAVGTTIYSGKIATVVYVRDITKRKQTEKRLKSLVSTEKKLRHQLEEQIRQRVEFTRALVHDLKTPLTPLISASDFIVCHIDEEPLKSFARQINNSALSLNTRVDELLDVTRGEVGLLKVKLKKVDIKGLLQESYDFFKPVASENNLSLTMVLPDELPIALADSKRIQQVIYNLLDNAIKYTPPGGQIELSASVQKQNIVIKIQDNGPGISGKDQKYLFQPYKRLRHKKGQLGGLGLGLAICKKLIDLHNESIWFVTKPGHGSTFCFSLAKFSPKKAKNFK